jgi:dihydroorotate dehydrogenase electron transfer subunit
MFYGKVLITENHNLAPGYYRLTLLAPEVAVCAKPGQFIQIRVAGSGSNDPLLARPISIFRINTAENTIALIYKVVGRGTSILSGLNQGTVLEIMGPVGNGFTIPPDTTKIALIAGGVGMPPLFCFAEELVRSRLGEQIHLFYGGRSKSDILELDLWNQLGIKVVTATEDGSMGQRGLVTELFMEEHRRSKFDFIAACGPQPMLQAVQKIALAEGKGIPGQISLEAHMACGVGACLGCTCNTHQGYKRVCVDGPVFSIAEVVWG